MSTHAASRAPLVSVIIPAYNVERFIKRAVASVLRQTYTNVEVLIVDDGSTDGTAGVVATLDDPRITYIRQENQGIGGARNTGIRQSRGEYIALLDADDVYLSAKVERQVAFLEGHPEYAAVYCNALHYYSGRRHELYKRRHVRPSGDILGDLLRFSFINPNTVMIRRALFTPQSMFAEGRLGRYAEDMDLFLRMASAGCLFGYVDDDLVVVESREGSNTTWEIQPIAKQNVLEVVKRTIAGMSAQERETVHADRIVKRLRLKLAIAHLAAGDKRAFQREIGQAVAVPLGVMLRSAVYPVPSGLLRTVIRRLWTLAQRRSAVRVRTQCG